MLAFVDVLVPLGAAALAGACVGLEREFQGQLAGMRTHALVATGAALFTWIGANGFAGADNAVLDPTRVAAQVVSGIGFIGAGAILRDRGTVRGVTTAAALWTSAALGMAAGAGLYLAALAGVLIVLIALIGMRELRGRVLGPLVVGSYTVEIVYGHGKGTLAPILEALQTASASLRDLHIADDEHHRRVRLTVRTRKPKVLQQQLQGLTRRPEVTAVLTYELDGPG